MGLDVRRSRVSQKVVKDEYRDGVTPEDTLMMDRCDRGVTPNSTTSGDMRIKDPLICLRIISQV